MKLTLGDIKANISKVLSLPSTDSRVLDYINEAQQRLMYKGKWKGLTARYTLTSSSGTITWPRQLETIEAVAVSDYPAQIRNEWYEFLEAGVGIQDSEDSDDLTLIDRGEAASFSDIDGTDKKIKTYSTNDADSGKTMIYQGYDENGDWIRTVDGTETIDGEKVTLGAVASPVTTTNFFSILSAVIRDETKYNVLVKEYTASNERLIAEYQPTETRPTYRRSLIAGLADNDTKSVVVVGKLRFIPAKNDNDWLYITYEAAIKLMVLAIRKEETNNMPEAAQYEGQAVQLLNDQLAHHMGDGQLATPRITNPEMFGGGGVANVI
tara:strand:- start:18259 stop:19227 length:969 start_codon:yes stop_codon:yes gene_type:complete